ncbi:hypothetical protein Tco_0150651 [Tanacetum coccineum]
MRKHANSLLSFHDAVDARSLWKAIKARFGGNEASKKMQKNLLKQQFETFTIGSREELDSAYERFQHILSMLELHDATVSIEDANLKFLRSLPSVWHVYEHELKGVSNSNSQNIAFLSTEVKGSTLKQSTAEPTNIPKGYTQAASSKEFDAEPVTYAMMALTGVEQDDWSMEFDAEHVHFGQDGLGDFDWSNKADDTTVSLSFNGYKLREEKQKELDQALKERDDFKVKLEKWSNASVLQNEVLNKQRYVSDKSCIGFGIESSDISIGNPEEDLKDYAIKDMDALELDMKTRTRLSDFKDFKDKECLILSPKFKFVDERSGNTEDEAVPMAQKSWGMSNFKNLNKFGNKADLLRERNTCLVVTEIAANSVGMFFLGYKDETYDTASAVIECTAGVQTRRKLLDSTSNQHQALLSFIYKQNRTNHKDQQTCLFACFLSQEEPKKVSQALADESWVEAMQEELLQFQG